MIYFFCFLCSWPEATCACSRRILVAWCSSSCTYQWLVKTRDFHSWARKSQTMAAIRKTMLERCLLSRTNSLPWRRLLQKVGIRTVLSTCMIHSEHWALVSIESYVLQNCENLYVCTSKTCKILVVICTQANIVERWYFWKFLTLWLTVHHLC